MHIKEIIDNNQIFHDDRKLSASEAMLCLVSKIDEGFLGVSYNSEIVIDLFYVDCLMKDGDKYFYDINLKRIVDMIDSIEYKYTGDVKTSMQVVVGCEKTDNVEKLTLVLCASLYSLVNLRINFDERPKSGDIITVKYKSYLFAREIRLKLLHDTLETDVHKYSNGMIMPID